MYFKESNGRLGTHGFAKADQSSCQRLNITTGRAHDCARDVDDAADVFVGSVVTIVVAVLLAPSIAVSAAEAGSAAENPAMSNNMRAARPVLSRPTRLETTPGRRVELLLHIMHFCDIPPRKFEHSGLARAHVVRGG